MVLCRYEPEGLRFKTNSPRGERVGAGEGAEREGGEGAERGGGKLCLNASESYTCRYIYL